MTNLGYIKNLPLTHAVKGLEIGPHLAKLLW